MDSQSVANTLVSLRRFSAEPEARETALGLADRIVCDKKLVATMNEKDVAIALYGLGYWADEPLVRAAILSLAEHILCQASVRNKMKNPHDVATSLHTVIKLRDERRARQIILYFVKQIAQEENLQRNMRETEMAMVLNDLEKWEDNEDARAVVLALADRVAKDNGLTPDESQVSIMSRALRKWSREEPVRQALRRLATFPSSASPVKRSEFLR